LDRLDFGEQDQEKGVVLVEIGPSGRRGEPVFVPIDATSLVDVTISDAATVVQQLALQVPDPDSAIVRILVEQSASDAETRVDLAIRDALPNISTVEWRSSQLTAPTAAT